MHSNYFSVESAGQFLAKYLQQHCANHTDIIFKGMVAQFDAHELELATISQDFSLTNTVSVTVTGYVQLGMKTNMTAKKPIPACTWTAVSGGLGAGFKVAMARRDPWIRLNVIGRVVLMSDSSQSPGSAKNGGGVGNNMIFSTPTPESSILFPH